MKNTAYCINCKKEIEYTLEDTFIYKDFKGKTYRFRGKEARCPICHNELGLPSVYDYNIHAFNDAYRRSNGLITVKEIQEILDKYKLDRRTLAIILGWQDDLLIEYLHGSMPTHEHSSLLKNIKEHPSWFYELLKNSRGQISALAFRDSKQATLRVIRDEKEKNDY